MKAMEKRQYEKPQIKIFDCQCRNSLLAGSTQLYLDENNILDVEDASGKKAF